MSTRINIKGGKSPREETDINQDLIEAKVDIIPKEWESFARGQETTPIKDPYSSTFGDFIVGDTKKEIWPEQGGAKPSMEGTEPKPVVEEVKQSPEGAGPSLDWPNLESTKPKWGEVKSDMEGTKTVEGGKAL